MQSRASGASPAAVAGRSVSKRTSLAARALGKDRLTNRERQFTAMVLGSTEGRFSVKFVLGARWLSASVYNKDPQPARRQAAAVSTDDVPVRECPAHQGEREEPERDGVYTAVQPKRKVPPPPPPAAVVRPKPKPAPRQPKVDKNALSARADGGKGGGKGCGPGTDQAPVTSSAAKSRQRPSPPLSPGRTTSSPPRKSPRGSEVASEADDSEMGDPSDSSESGDGDPPPRWPQPWYGADDHFLGRDLEDDPWDDHG